MFVLKICLSVIFLRDAYLYTNCSYSFRIRQRKSKISLYAKLGEKIILCKFSHAFLIVFKLFMKRKLSYLVGVKNLFSFSRVLRYLYK